MPISILFMFAYQIRNPVHCWRPSPFLVGVPTISSFNIGSPSHTHFYFSYGSPHQSFLFLAGVPAHSFLFLAGVPASYHFQLRESPPHINFNCGSPRLISISIAGVPAHLGLHSIQFHQFHPNLINKDEENNWSFIVIHNFTFHHNFL